MELFDLRYEQYTPDLKLNFIGSVRRYFDEINKDNLPKTNDSYIEYYNSSIFPYINTGKAVESYEMEDVEDLIKLVQQQNNYTDSTVSSTIRHLVYDPIKFYFAEYCPDDNIFEISPTEFITDEVFEVDEFATELRIVKSLTVSEEKKAFDLLFKDPETMPGEDIGLAIMFFTATRNNEACGLNYGDILEMIEYRFHYYLQITKTTMINSSELKAGGKTFNAPRRLPLVDSLASLLRKRIRFLMQKIRFPYQYEDRVYKSVYELPIVCRGFEYGKRCNSRDLTIAGRNFLRDRVGMTKSRLAGIQRCILTDRNTEFDLGEKDVTTYLLRRNMATHLYSLGFSVLESQYYMGHEMEGTGLKRSDFGDEEFLYSLWQKLQKHPLNKVRKCINRAETDSGLKKVSNQYYWNYEMKPGIYSLKITGNENHDPIKVDIQGLCSSISILESQTESRNGEEINVTKLIQAGYNVKQ